MPLESFLAKLDIITPEQLQSAASDAFGHECVVSDVQRLHNIKRPQAGAIDNPIAKFSCRDYLLGNARKAMLYLTENYAPVREMQHRISACLSLLHEACGDSAGFSFIHYELGPNHVMVDKNNTAYLIDIEGAKFFDLEVEHSFLKLRFGENYQYFANRALSHDKMEFCSFCHFLGILSGAHELSTKDYPDMDDVNGMIRFGYGQIKRFCDKYAV